MRRQIRPRQIIPQFAIIGDGFTEKIYFDQLRVEENLKSIIIKPEFPNKSGKGGGHVKVFSRCDELIEKGYDFIYCLIDYDKIIEENNIERYNRDKDKIQKSKRVIVLENNPCFEIWFLLQFRTTAHLFNSCGDVETELCKNINDYCKNQDYLRKKNIYTFLHGQKPIAIVNAKLLEADRVDVSPRFPRAEVYRLIEDLLG